MIVICNNPLTGKWMELLEPVGEITTYRIDEVVAALQTTCQRTSNEGLYAAGYVSYEAAPAFDENFKVHSSIPTQALAAFGLFKTIQEYQSLDELAADRGYTCDGERNALYSTSACIPDMDAASYIEKISSIKDSIFRGDTYQVNFTFRLDSFFSGDSFAWFLDIAKKNPGDYCFYIECEESAICSFSPELFFRKQQKQITLKPMKGSAIRNPETDDDTCAALRADPKNRAENLMIVDMIRNDAGRIADTGTVEVPRLFETEIYPTIIQMTSTVTARTQAGIPELFSALFPCASITGAPKIRSMDIIRDLENSPRGIYTGAAGFITPDQDCVFNVAIRTAHIDKKRFTASYGTGSGIVWDSKPEDEWEECMAKTAILKNGTDFFVFESMLLENGNYFLQNGHLSRMMRACDFFRLPYNEEHKKETAGLLVRTALDHPQGSYKVRIKFDGQSVSIDCDPISSLNTPCTLLLSGTRVEPDDPFLRHKTNRRRHIDSALESVKELSVPNATDVILINSREELTETSRANIVLEIDGQKFTPHHSSGLLPGVFREELLENGTVKEMILHPSDLLRSQKVYIINSVRKWIECTV